MLTLRRASHHFTTSFTTRGLCFCRDYITGKLGAGLQGGSQAEPVCSLNSTCQLCSSQLDCNRVLVQGGLPEGHRNLQVHLRKRDITAHTAATVPGLPV